MFYNIMLFQRVLARIAESEVYIPEVHSLFAGGENRKQQYNDSEDTSKYLSTVFQSEIYQYNFIKSQFCLEFYLVLQAKFSTLFSFNRMKLRIILQNSVYRP